MISIVISCLSYIFITCTSEPDWILQPIIQSSVPSSPFSSFPTFPFQPPGPYLDFSHLNSPTQLPIFRDVSYAPITELFPEKISVTKIQSSDHTSSSTSPSILSVISSLAEIINATIERDKRRNIPQTPSGRVKRISLLRGKAEYGATSFQHFKAHRLAKLVNSMPTPSIMFRLGDLMSRKHPMSEDQDDQWDIKKGSNEEDTEVPHSFSITSSEGLEEAETGKQSTEKSEESSSLDDNTLIQLLKSGRWEKIDWARKLLGYDEITTAREGNAFAQLLEDG